MAATPAVSASEATRTRDIRPELLIGLAVLVWAGEIFWFWRFCGRNVNIDAVSYIGIARHLADGNITASLHGYWSPLVSWLIAASSIAGRDWTLTARLLMLPELLLCLGLAYRLTLKLWKSRLLAALVVLWFTLARGVVAFSVNFLGADFLLTAAMLVYFIVLFNCLEHPAELRNWFWLGAAHGAAFLCKAIALPLLALTTVAAVLWTSRERSKRALPALSFAALVPLVVWAGWSAALQHKYGVFTSGYQLRWNLLDPEVKRAAATSAGLAVLTDTRPVYDSYMVTDSMPPGSPLWHVRVWRSGLLRVMLRREMENLPLAGKELLVLLTPGGWLALILCAAQFTVARRSWPVHFRFVWIAFGTTIFLLLAYCMLVFDARYALPAAPLLMSLGIGFALPKGMTREEGDEFQPDLGERVPQMPRVQTLAGVLLVLGLIAVQVYWASPFRTIHQDFQLCVRDAAESLKSAGARNIVVIGVGPYPEHGVEWEAGVYAAYFAHCRIVAELDEIPAKVHPAAIAADLARVAPDAVVIWGTPSSNRYTALVREVQTAFPDAAARSIHDGGQKIVGTVLVLRHRA